MIEISEVPCPECATTPNERVGVSPDGVHVQVQCPRCYLSWTVTG